MNLNGLTFIEAVKAMTQGEKVRPVESGIQYVTINQVGDFVIWINNFPEDNMRIGADEVFRKWEIVEEPKKTLFEKPAVLSSGVLINVSGDVIKLDGQKFFTENNIKEALKAFRKEFVEEIGEERVINLLIKHFGEELLK